MRRIGAAINSQSHGLVLRGPFRGMSYGTAGGWDLASKLLGTYELELHSELERLIAKGFDRVINVGCAEGYYAIGLALRMPRAEIFAFDIDERVRETCIQLARHNNVSDRVHVGDECTIAALNRSIVGRTLVVVDIEGAELSLLRPSIASNLRKADIIVELHDMVDPSTSATVIQRFDESHNCTLLQSTTRDPFRYGELESLPWSSRVDALDERRPCTMEWAVFDAKVAR
jgi:precorrin-6B methylase 2